MYPEAIEFSKKRLVLPIERGLNAVFSQKYNPFYYHGALPNFFIWALFLSGLLLFAYYSGTLAKAYDTVQYITVTLPFGNAIRAIHRYASDGMMIFVMLHLFRVWLTDRYREYRILPWITGVILLAITFIIGLTGYILVWDQDAVNLANTTFNMMNQIPVIGPGLANFFRAGELVTDYTLSRMLFFHLGIPLLMMFMLWMHYMRITRPVSVPPLALNLIMLGGLLLVAALFPVGLGPMPSPNPNEIVVPAEGMEFNIFYAWPQLLVASGWDTALVWAMLLAVPLGLLALPYIQKKALRDQFAQVVKENCTGCSLCYHDCPYEAITMVDRNDPGVKFKRLAVVDAGRCSNCGLCVGACAFKAIEVPRRETTSVLEEIELALS